MPSPKLPKLPSPLPAAPLTGPLAAPDPPGDAGGAAAPLLPTVSIVEETMRQARRAVAWALVGAALMVGALLAERQWSAVALQKAAERHAVANRLVGELRVADQELTLAAQMAAITGAAEWIERYERQLPALTQAIEHASILASPEAAARFRADTAASAELLARMQRSALEALKSGAADSARSLFDSPRYAEQRKKLRDATDLLTTESLAATGAEVDTLKERSFWIACAMLVATLGLGFVL